LISHIKIIDDKTVDSPAWMNLDQLINVVALKGPEEIPSGSRKLFKGSVSPFVTW